jgi:hypothetical protein
VGRASGSTGSGAGDALDGAVGASGHPVIALKSDLKVVLAAQLVDFRKSSHTLSALVSEALRANPFCGDVSVFHSKRRLLRCPLIYRTAGYSRRRNSARHSGNSAHCP